MQNSTKTFGKYLYCIGAHLCFRFHPDHIFLGTLYSENHFLENLSYVVLNNYDNNRIIDGDKNTFNHP